MSKLWNPFKLGLLVACLLLAITGCGQTGPGTGQSGNVGSNNNNNTTSTGTSASSLNSQSSSVSSNPVSGNPELTAHVDQLEFLEGSDPESNKVLPVVFTLSKPLPDDAVLNIAVDAHYGVGIFAGRIAEGKSLNLSKGTTEFTVHLESYVNNEPEADKYPVWNLSLTMNGETFTLPTDNGIKIIDDDKMSSEDVNSDTGEVVDFDLNGIGKPLGDDKFTVTQIKGPTTAFKVSGDKLRLLMPAPNDFTRRGASMQAGDNASVKFQVTSLKGENYELEYELMSSTRFVSLRWSYNYDGDGESDSPGKPDQYLQSVTLNKQGPHHLILNDAVAPKLEFKYLNDRIHINENTPIQVFVSELRSGKKPSLSIYAQVSADGKALQISDADWMKIKNTVDMREQGVELYIQMNLKDSEAELAQGENYFGQDFDLYVSLRVADKTASVTLDDKIPDAAITGQKLFFVLSDSYKSGPGDGIVIIKPVTQRTTTFNYLYSSDFYIRLVDLSAVYSGDVHALLEKKDVVNSAVTMKVDVAEPSNQTVPEASSAKKKLNKMAEPNSPSADPSPVDTCHDDEGEYLVSIRSTKMDQENKCVYTFTKEDLGISATANSNSSSAGSASSASSNASSTAPAVVGKQQLVVKVQTLEWPSFSTAKASKFDDLWSAKITSNVTDLGLTLDQKNVSVSKSNYSGRNKYFASNCIDFSKLTTVPEIKIEMSATNKGDDQLTTQVAAYLRDCDLPANINFVAKAIGGMTTKGLRIMHFINPIDGAAKGEDGRLFLSIPKDLPSDISITNPNRQFDAYIDVLPADVGLKTTDFTINSVRIVLLQPQTGDHIIAEIETIPSSSPKVVITDKAAKDGNYKQSFKRISMDHYALPNNITSPGTSYDIYNRTISLGAIVNVTIDGRTFDLENGLMNVTVIAQGIENVAQFFPLYELQAIKQGDHPYLQAATRWNWNPVNSITNGSGGRYGLRENDIGGDGWISPALWQNLFANPLPAPTVNCTTPIVLTNGHCDSTINDNQDFIDELRLGDASAINVRCDGTISDNAGKDNEILSHCSSILGHSSHHNGRALDVRYLMPDGTVKDGEYGGQPVGHFYTRWCNYYTATTDAGKTAIRKELRNFILRNRNFVEWISSSMADTDTPFRQAFMGKNLMYDNNLKKSVAVKSSTACSGKTPPTIRDFIVNGKLPGITNGPNPTPADNGTPADESDDDLQQWSLSNKILSAQDHDHHMHLDFNYNPDALNHAD